MLVCSGMSGSCIPVLVLPLLSQRSNKSSLTMCYDELWLLVPDLLCRQKRHKQKNQGRRTEAWCNKLQVPSCKIHVSGGDQRRFLNDCLFYVSEESFSSFLFSSWWRRHRSFHPDESAGQSSVFFVISLLLFRVYIYSCTVYIYSNTLIILSAPSQALASHRTYLLTARIPAKVRVCFYSLWTSFT